MGIRKRTCDHLIPKSAGGPNLYENRVAACMECNSAKGSTDAITFVRSLGRFARIRPADVEVHIRKVEKAMRSEEHTSELQSLMRISYAVLCLKQNKYNHTNKNMHRDRRN